jgi:hypothetical protein
MVGKRVHLAMIRITTIQANREAIIDLGTILMAHTEEMKVTTIITIITITLLRSIIIIIAEIKERGTLEIGVKMDTMDLIIKNVEEVKITATEVTDITREIRLLHIL